MITIRERGGELRHYFLERDGHGVLWIADVVTRWQLLGTMQELG